MKLLVVCLLVWNLLLSCWAYRLEQENFSLYQNQRTISLRILHDEQVVGTLKTQMASEHKREKKLESLVLAIARLILSAPSNDPAPDPNTNGY